MDRIVVLDRPDSEIRRQAENFTFYVTEYAAKINGYFTELIISQIIKDRTKYLAFLKYYDRQTFEAKKNLVHIILESKYNDILQKYPDIFTEIDTVQFWRNKLDHYTKHYLHNPDDSYTFVLDHPIVVKQLSLSVEQMNDILQAAEKCDSNVFAILQQILKNSSI